MLTNCLAACVQLTITVSEIQRDICGKKIVILLYPFAFDVPVRGVPVAISAPSSCADVPLRNYTLTLTHSSYARSFKFAQLNRACVRILLYSY